MKVSAVPALACALLLPLAAPAGPAGEPLDLTRDGKAACAVVTVGGEKAPLLLDRAAETIALTVQRWGGAALPRRHAPAAATVAVPDGPALILGTPGDLARAFPDLAEAHPDVGRAAALAHDGFALVPCEAGGVRHLAITGPTPRGIFNGAVYLRDFLIDGPAAHLQAEWRHVTRSPRMEGRAMYVLTIWDNEQDYAVADWKVVFDSLARDGFDRVYFWVSGHFPSAKFPATYKCRDNDWDRTDRTKIGTVEDLRALVRYGHDLGLRVYLGSALGGWVGTRFVTGNDPETFKTGAGIAPQSLCPSHPKSRRCLIDYHKEMMDAIPEADGLYIESADEWGGCTEPRCARALDDAGSTAFGQAQLTLAQDIMRAVWADHPQARLAYTIGYPEHAKDPAYYETIRAMRDPRFEWMEARESWQFPDRTGAPHPAAAFSPRVMRWRIYEDAPLNLLVEETNRAAREGFYGMVISFQPGAVSGSFYRDIPFPVDALPYVLTYFVYRELTWEAPLTPEALKLTVRRRFFGGDAPAALADALLDLREVIREAVPAKAPREKLLDRLKSAEAAADAAEADAAPKAKEGIGLIRRAVRDTRAHLARK